MRDCGGYWKRIMIEESYAMCVVVSSRQAGRGG